MISMAADLLDEAQVGRTLKPDGLILVNTPHTVDQFSPLRAFHLSLVDASSIAEQAGLGTAINTAILGAYCRANGDVPLAALEEAIRETVPAKVEANLEAARGAYEITEMFPPVR